jgi:hypothetical protein
MTLWWWMLIAAGCGLITGAEAWAWTRHGTSAVGLLIAGTLGAAGSLLAVAVGVVIFGSFGYGIVDGVTGFDPLHLDTASSSTGSSSGACDANYSGGCVPAGVGDVDCSDISATDVQVVGTDVDGLDRDGDGIGCES